MRRISKTVVGAALAGSVGLVSALGGVPPAGAASTPPATSVDLSFTLSVTTGATTVTANGSGQVNFATDQLALTVNVPGGLAPLLSLLPSALSGVTAGIGSATQVQVAVSGGTVFVTVPGLTLTHKSSVGLSFSPTTVAKVFSTAASALTNGKATLSSIRLHAHHVHGLGHRTVDGVKATGSGGSVPTARLASFVPGFGSAVAPAISGDVGATTPIKVWTNAQGQMVQIAVDASHQTKTGTISVTGTINFSGYGSPVTVTPPAAGTYVTVPASTLLSLLPAAAKVTGAAKHWANS